MIRTLTAASSLSPLFWRHLGDCLLDSRSPPSSSSLFSVACLIVFPLYYLQTCPVRCCFVRLWFCLPACPCVCSVVLVFRVLPVEIVCPVVLFLFVSPVAHRAPSVLPVVLFVCMDFLPGPYPFALLACLYKLDLVLICLFCPSACRITIRSQSDRS